MITPFNDQEKRVQSKLVLMLQSNIHSDDLKALVKMKTFYQDCIDPGKEIDRIELEYAFNKISIRQIKVKPLSSSKHSWMNWVAGLYWSGRIGPNRTLTLHASFRNLLKIFLK